MQTENVSELKGLYSQLEANQKIIRSLEILIEKILDSDEDNLLAVDINVPKHIETPKSRDFICMDHDGKAIDPPPFLKDLLAQFGGLPAFRIQLTTPVQTKFLMSMIDCIRDENKLITRKIKELQ